MLTWFSLVLDDLGAPQVDAVGERAPRLDDAVPPFGAAGPHGLHQRLVGTLSAYGAGREVEQLHGILQDDERKILGRRDVRNGLDVVQAHSSKALEPEGVELTVAEPDLELTKLGERRRHDNEPRGFQVPRPPGRDARVALDEQLAAIHSPPASEADLVEQVLGKRPVLDEVALHVDKVQRGQYLAAESIGAPGHDLRKGLFHRFAEVRSGDMHTERGVARVAGIEVPGEH